MDMNKAVAHIQIQIQIGYNLEKQQLNYGKITLSLVVTTHMVGKIQTFAIYTILRHGSQRGNVCKHAHSCMSDNIANGAGKLNVCVSCLIVHDSQP